MAEEMVLISSDMYERLTKTEKSPQNKMVQPKKIENQSELKMDAIIEHFNNDEIKLVKEIMDKIQGKIQITDDYHIIYEDGSIGSSLIELLESVVRSESDKPRPIDLPHFLHVMKLQNLSSKELDQKINVIKPKGPIITRNAKWLNFQG